LALVPAGLEAPKAPPPILFKRCITKLYILKKQLIHSDSNRAAIIKSCACIPVKLTTPRDNTSMTRYKVECQWLREAACQVSGDHHGCQKTRRKSNLHTAHPSTCQEDPPLWWRQP